MNPSTACLQYCCSVSPSEKLCKKEVHLSCPVQLSTSNHIHNAPFDYLWSLFHPVTHLEAQTPAATATSTSNVRAKSIRQVVPQFLSNLQTLPLNKRLPIYPPSLGSQTAFRSHFSGLDQGNHATPKLCSENKKSWLSVCCHSLSPTSKLPSNPHLLGFRI